MTFEEIVKLDHLVLVDFFAEWCGPCKMVAPILKDVKATIGEQARIVKIDIDRNQQTAMQYQIQSVPTLMLFKNGEPVWRQSGVVPKHNIVSIIEKFKN